MLWLSTAELAAAVSNAGGLGVLSPFAGMEKNGDALRNLRFQITEVRDLTQKPFFSLIPQVADVVSIPIIAAGGIVDARGVVAAFALGAEGVQLGTRFVAVEENIANPNYKQAIIDAKDTDTVITCRKLLPTRSLKTELTRRLLELEASGASADTIRDFLGTSRARKGQIEGDLVNGEVYCGSSVGLIKEILPAAAVIQRLVDGFQEIVKKIA